MEGLLILLAAIAVVLLIVYSGKRTGARASPRTARQGGTGHFDTEVVGESFYRPAYQQLFRQEIKSDPDGEVFCKATLRLDDDNQYDNQAVGVYIKGRQVGNLDRAAARRFRSTVRGRQGSEFTVPARVYLGGDDERFSISLNVNDC